MIRPLEWFTNVKELSHETYPNKEALLCHRSAMLTTPTSSGSDSHCTPTLILRFTTLAARANKLIKDFLQLGRQRQGRRRFKNEYTFSWNFATDWMCLPSLPAPKANLSTTYDSDDEF